MFVHKLIGISVFLFMIVWKYFVFITCNSNWPYVALWLIKAEAIIGSFIWQFHGSMACHTTAAAVLAFDSRLHLEIIDFTWAIILWKLCNIRSFNFIMQFFFLLYYKAIVFVLIYLWHKVRLRLCYLFCFVIFFLSLCIVWCVCV